MPDPTSRQHNKTTLKETEIGMLPAEWDVVPLGDLSEVNYGKARPKTEGSIPVVGSGGIYASADNALVYSPTIVIGRKGSAGRTWLIENPCWPSDTTFYLELTQRINLYFLFSYLTLNPLSGQHAKTTLPSLSRPYLESYPVPVPPLPEQRRIAGALRIIQEAIAVQENVIAAARELKHSLMERLFTYGPGAEPAPTKETEIGEIPEHWTVIHLGHIAQVNYGKTRPKTEGKVPVIGSGGIYAWTDKALVNFSTVIIGRKGSAGEVWLMDKPCWPSDTTFYLKLKEDIDVYFLYNYLKRNPLSGEHAKTTLPSLQRPDLENQVIPLPPLPEQHRIANVLHTTQKSIAAEEQRKSALEEVFRSTLEQLLTGQIRI